MPRPAAGTTAPRRRQDVADNVRSLRIGAELSMFIRIQSSITGVPSVVARIRSCPTPRDPFAGIHLGRADDRVARGRVSPAGARQRPILYGTEDRADAAAAPCACDRRTALDRITFAGTTVRGADIRVTAISQDGPIMEIVPRVFLRRPGHGTAPRSWAPGIASSPPAAPRHRARSGSSGARCRTPSRRPPRSRRRRGAVRDAARRAVRTSRPPRGRARGRPGCARRGGRARTAPRRRSRP